MHVPGHRPGPEHLYVYMYAHIGYATSDHHVLLMCKGLISYENFRKCPATEIVHRKRIAIGMKSTIQNQF